MDTTPLLITNFGPGSASCYVHGYGAAASVDLWHSTGESEALNRQTQ